MNKNAIIDYRLLIINYFLGNLLYTMTIFAGFVRNKET